MVEEATQDSARAAKILDSWLAGFGDGTTGADGDGTTGADGAGRLPAFLLVETKTETDVGEPERTRPCSGRRWSRDGDEVLRRTAAINASSTARKETEAGKT